MTRAAISTFDAALPHGITLACRANFAAKGGEAGGSPRFGVRPRVMLLHGFPEAAFVWDEVMRCLADRADRTDTADRIDAVAPQLRGYAGSSAPADVSAYRTRHLVADLAALIEQLGAPLDLLVAHDWGGAVAWSLAAQRPALLKRLLIINSPHPGPFLKALRDDPRQQRASAYMNFLCRPDAEALLAEGDFRRLWPFFGEGAPSRWLDEPMKQRYRAVWRAGLAGPLNYYRASPLKPATGSDDAILRLALDDEAITVRVPTHVLWGEQDEALLPVLLDGLERWVPALTLERVPDAGHWIVHEQPARIVRTISQLLGAASAAPA